MEQFLDALASFPTAVFTTLLVVVLFYWVLALIGVVDFTSDGLEIGGEVDSDAPGALASVMMAMGLHDVPLSVVVSFLVLSAWTFSCLGAMWLLPLLPDGTLFYPAGAVLALGSMSLSVPLTARSLRPFKGLFVTHAAQRNASLVGQTCKVLTQSVDEKLGRAEVTQLGASLNIRVWSPAPNPLVRGTLARIVAYDEARARYRIEAER